MDNLFEIISILVYVKYLNLFLLRKTQSWLLNIMLVYIDTDEHDAHGALGLMPCKSLSNPHRVSVVPFAVVKDRARFPHLDAAPVLLVVVPFALFESNVLRTSRRRRKNIKSTPKILRVYNALVKS